MKVGLLVIGSEILDGKTTDANTKALADFLTNHHLQLETNITVRDDAKSIHQGLETLMAQCEIIITSGGLGPTKDDITKEALASYLGRKIIFSDESMKVAQKNYARFNWSFPGKEHGYSWIPEGFIPLDNSTGFAPSLFAQHLDKFLLCGAGVPREFKALLVDHFQNLLGDRINKEFYRTSFNIRTKKVPEEKIFSEVDPELWDRLSDLGEVCSLPNLLGVDIGVKLEARTEIELQSKNRKVLEIFNHSPVRDITWQIGNKTLEEFIVQLASKLNLTFAFAESCTGGLCSHRITSVPGSSKALKGSVVSYTNAVKEKLLGVQSSTLEKFSDVSEETASEMAMGLKKNLDVDVAVSITGIAGPTGELPGKPVGTFCIGVASRGQCKTMSFNFKGDRELLKSRFSQAALFALLEELEEIARP